ncbi:MAG TPA: pyrimidine-nucleoside phosphorylase [Saprospiraceae bacterium]|nr:pyrimidine-nucleoside phosphorylase [Lewinellaceae bacterium]HPK10486.1 pyrimidine-nucleoside phosphorylase [Saprospiraceae bacterium]
MVQLIKKKRDGQSHSREEIIEIIEGFVKGDIPDYQISAWLMAVLWQGLNEDETAWLTEAMMNSGEVIDLSEIPGIIVDKHSTGGVGDKTTLVLAPLVSSVGVHVAKMSGRGLGHTGGTLDKLESIEGFKVDMSPQAFIERVKNHGIAICSQNAQLVPGDKKLYALRDVTGTIDNISLIASSIMSKKLACGADAIVIDLKVGDGAFMKNLESAELLAETMISTANRMGRKLVAIVTDMNNPLGNAIGNSLELKEAMDTLLGEGPDDLTELCLTLGSQMLMLAERVDNLEKGRELLLESIKNGSAIQKFYELVESQGGNLEMVKHPEKLPSTTFSYDYRSSQSGYVQSIFAQEIGLAAVSLGAGRETKDSAIDFGAGIMLLAKPGDKVEKGDVLMRLYANDKAKFEIANLHLDRAIIFSNEKPEKSPLIIKTIQ